MKYIIVIVTYNRIKLLKECVVAALWQTYPPYKIVIINNCSTDGTDDYLESLDQQEILIVHERQNSGGAGGFYTGMQEAMKFDFDYVLLIDDDAILDKDYLLNINNYTEKNAEVGSLAGAVFTDGSIDISHRRLLDTTSCFKEISVKAEIYNREMSFEVDLASFCGILVNKKVVEKIGLPMRDYFIWFDDSEYSLRIRKHSKIVVVPSAKLNHKTKITPLTGSKKLTWKSYYGIRNKLDAIRRHCAPEIYSVEIKKVLNDYHREFMRAFRYPKEFKVHMSNYRLIKKAYTDANHGKLGKDNIYRPLLTVGEEDG